MIPFLGIVAFLPVLLALGLAIAFAGVAECAGLLLALLSTRPGVVFFVAVAAAVGALVLAELLLRVLDRERSIDGAVDLVAIGRNRRATPSNVGTKA